MEPYPYEIIAALGCNVRDCHRALQALRGRWEVLQIQRRGPYVRYGRPAQVMRWLFDRERRPLARRDILDHVVMSRGEWKRVSSDLVEEGVLHVEGSGLGRFYSLAGQVGNKPMAPRREVVADDADDWVACVERFLLRLLARTRERSLGFAPMRVTSEDEVSDVEDGWLWIEWVVSERHYFIVAVGRKKLDRVSVTVSFSSSFARRDPGFRAVCRELGAVRPSDRVVLDGATFVFCPKQELTLECAERVELGALDSDGYVDDMERRLRLLADAVMGGVRELGGEEVDDEAEAESDPEPSDWIAHARGFLGRCFALLGERMSGARVVDVTPPDDLDEPEEGWLMVQWWTSELHYFFLAVGRKRGAQVRVRWGYASQFVRRDPDFRDQCAKVGVAKRGDTLHLGSIAYQYCPEDDLSLHREERIELGRLADPALSTSVCDALFALVERMGVERG